MDYQYKVIYGKDNKVKTYSSIKDITQEFNISKEMIVNIYSSISNIKHPSISSIERIAPPLQQKKKIVVSFD